MIQLCLSIQTSDRQGSSSNATTRPKRNIKYKKTSCITAVTSENNSEDKNLVKYDINETLEVKQEIFEIEYENHENLDIKVEISQDQEPEEITDRSFNTKYESNVCTVYVKEDILAGNIEHRSKKKQEIQNFEPENKYKCTKCARSYRAKKNLTSHQKYECDVIPQFTCNFCGKLFKRKTHMTAHVSLVHLKPNLHTSKKKFNCNICTRSYNSSDTLNRHKREKHAAVKPQYVCDYCGYKTNQKSRLVPHISCRHLKKFSARNLNN
ncbi:zinc finger protein 90 homolog [Belonocnema kinseyi]|uniref:zinc finger protein 90 homolog n=1 Tax=Belonocnema kinseyi TaxID=2817044 RepID=UPI00143DBB15|nr:zinc finger protein 90 homolog [Belonocnema kinseyi]